MAIMVILALIILLRIGSIQFFEGEALRAMAAETYIDTKEVAAPRGSILAKDGSLLATSLPYFSVHMDTKTVDDELFYSLVDTLAYCLATYVDDTYTVGAYRKRLIQAKKEGNRYLLIRNNVTYPQLQLLKSFPIFNLNDPNKSGLIDKRMSKRQYPFNMLAHRTIGYKRVLQKTGPDGQAVFDEAGDPVADTVMVGLESYFDPILSGEAGLRKMQRMSGNIWIPVNDLSEIEPRAGKDILTTIDVNIQDVAEKALLRGLRKYNGKHGCAVVMDVKTGAIRAIANIGYNSRRSQKYWEDYNYAIGEKVEPGSTFKLAAVMALLEDGYVTVDDMVNLEKGKTKFYKEEMTDASYHGLNTTTLGKAFEISSNVGIAKLTNRYYNETGRQMDFVQRLRDMKLHLPTNIEIEGEPQPYIKDVQDVDWSGISIPWMSIGYEVQVTALQLLTFYNAVANGGKMMKPYLVQEVRSYGETKQYFEPVIIKREIASEKTIQQAQQLLERVVHGKRGTAHSIAPEHYRIAGKTGTAIMNYKAYKERREEKRYRATFVGYFPADNPAYSCVVMVTDPETGHYGGTVCAPIFREIADKCYVTATQSHEAINETAVAYNTEKLPNLQIGYKADFDFLLDELRVPHQSEANSVWTVARAEQDTLRLLLRNNQDEVMPNVRGMGLRDALYLLENKKIRVLVRGVGKVKSQSVPAGRSLRSIRSVTLTLG